MNAILHIAPRAAARPVGETLYVRPAQPGEVAFESDWSEPCPYPFTFMPRGSVVREADCGGDVYTATASEPSIAELDKAAAELAAAAPNECDADATRSLLAARRLALLADPDALRDAVRRWKGVVHPLARLAPASIRTARGAVGVLNVASGLWEPHCRGATLRANLAGRYEVMFEPDLAEIALHTAYEAANYASHRAQRARCTALPRLLDALPGWPRETPMLGATLGTLGQLPVEIYALPPVGSHQQDDPTLWLRMETNGDVLERLNLPWDEAACLAEVTARNARLVDAERTHALAAHAELVRDLLCIEGMRTYFKESGRLLNRRHKPTVWWGAGQHHGQLTGSFRRTNAGEIELCVTRATIGLSDIWINASWLARATSAT